MAERLSRPEFQGAYDPHVWFDVSLWSPTAERSSGRLSRRTPRTRADYAANAGEYLAAPAGWTLRSRAGRACSRAERCWYHGARRVQLLRAGYGFERPRPPGDQHPAEAGTADVQDLAEFIVSASHPRDLRGVLDPTPHDRGGAGGGRPRAATTYGSAAALFSDAMGSAGDAGGTYDGWYGTTSTRSSARCWAPSPDALGGQRQIGRGERTRTPAIEVNDLTVAYREKPVLGTWTG